MKKYLLLMMVFTGSLFGENFSLGGSVSTLYFSNNVRESAPAPIKNIYNIDAEYTWGEFYTQLSAGVTFSDWESFEGTPVPTEQYTAAAIETLDIFVRPRVGFRFRISSFSIGGTLSWAMMLPLVTEARGGVDEEALSSWFTEGLNLWHGEGRLVGEYYVSERSRLSLSVDYLKFFSENYALGVTAGFLYKL